MERVGVAFRNSQSRVVPRGDIDTTGTFRPCSGGAH
jgi:hypothetical protein